MSLRRTGRPFRRPSLEQCTCPECENSEDPAALGEHEQEPEETSPLLRSGNRPTPLPKVQVSALLLLFLPESVTSTLIYPFIVQLVRSLNIVKGDSASVGYYSGLIESCFFVTEAIFVFFWARVSDKVGRKPVVLFGSLGLAIALTCFGFSTTLFGVMASRALQGALNGNTGVVRAMLSEVTDHSNRAQAFAFTPIVWASGSTLGPLVGGLLAQPAERFPAFKNWFWERHPYLLPCIAAALLSLTAFIVSLTCVRETNRTATSLFKRLTHKEPALAHTSYGAVSVGNGNGAPIEEPAPVSQGDDSLRALFTRRLCGVLVNHALLAILEHCYLALVAVFLATPITSGGLGFSPSYIGMILGITGLTHGVLQTVCFPVLYRTFEPKALYTTCQMFMVAAYACFPALNALARSDPRGTLQPSVWVLLVFQLLLLLPSYTSFSAMFIFISSASPTPALLGTTNGVAQTVFSSMGAIGPAGVTSLFAVSIERNLLGGNLVYVVMCTLSIISVLASVLFLPENPGEEASTLEAREEERRG